jgi:hypothetical protein
MPRAANATDDDDDDNSPAVRFGARPPAVVTVAPVAAVVALTGAATAEDTAEAGPVLATVPGACRAPTVAEGVEGGAVAVVLGVVVGGGAGTQIAVEVAGPRGAGSVGSPAPFGCQRQPSTMPLVTRHDAGPKLLYDHFPPLPCQYDQ